MSRMKTVIAGGLLAGALDIADAFLFWGIRAGVKPMRIGQSIAGGVMGEAASRGGWGTFAVGMALHFAMAVVMAVVFFEICKRVTVVARHALVFGALYGAGLYLVMTYLVVPLSLAQVGQNPKFPPDLNVVLLNTLFCHVVLVGLVVAWFSKRALRTA